MPSPLLQLRIPQDLAAWLEAKCPARGDASKYVRQLLTAEQMKEATAPLVPDGSSFADWNSPEDEAYDEVPVGGWPPVPEALKARVLAAVDEAVKQRAEPKPKARRKDVRKIPDQPVSVKNRGGRIMKTQEPPSNVDHSAPRAKGRGRKGAHPLTDPSDPAVGRRGGLASNLPSETVTKPRKPKGCTHANPIRKLGMPFCEDCGEFV